MYSTLWQWPMAVLLCLSNLAVLTGHIFKKMVEAYEQNLSN